MFFMLNNVIQNSSQRTIISKGSHKKTCGDPNIVQTTPGPS